MSEKYKTYHTSKYLSKEDVENLIKEGVDEVTMPKSIYEYMEKKNKGALNRLLIFGVDVSITDQVGRPKKVEGDIKKKIIEEIINGKSIRKVAEEYDLKKSTIWDNIKEDMAKIKQEKFRKMIYDYKELLIEKERYTDYIETLFCELDMHISNDNLKEAEKILLKIIEYSKRKD
ncbi:hypothetical protein [Methanococcus maripaludis]|uniref:Transposase-like protein n=1 Tax=Methanococcus maripaludis TaxID=39152 RepID=A0A7J9PTF9_METMI|nr:hypothetical protein [Methanococcus maripaludis]MBA2868959.1 transposase-like protein [Methanococcus maripaludis]